MQTKLEQNQHEMRARSGKAADLDAPQDLRHSSLGAQLLPLAEQLEQAVEDQTERSVPPVAECFLESLPGAGVHL